MSKPIPPLFTVEDARSASNPSFPPRSCNALLFWSCMAPVEWILATSMCASLQRRWPETATRPFWWNTSNAPARLTQATRSSTLISINGWRRSGTPPISSQIIIALMEIEWERSDIPSAVTSRWHMLPVKRLPPTLIIHGKEDQRVPFARAMELEALLKKLGTPLKTEFYPNERHILS